MARRWVRSSSASWWASLVGAESNSRCTAPDLARLDLTDTSRVLGVDVYELSVDLRPGVRDTEFVAALDAYLSALASDGRIEGWRLLRRKLGLGAGQEFKVLIETRDLAQLDDAFQAVSRRDDPLEKTHHRVNSLVTNFGAALYRDFPDPHRIVGQERF